MTLTMSDLKHVMAPSERESIESRGYLVVPDALSSEALARVRTAVDHYTQSKPPGDHPGVNDADILGVDDAFLDLIDLPTVFPKIWGILGWNIWVNHSHVTVHYPDGAEQSSYGWHRDGGDLHRDLGKSAPTVSVKVGYYLDDITTENSPTYVLPDGAPTPEAFELPEAAEPLLVDAGTAILYTNRVLHSRRSRNRTSAPRRTVFIQYAYRWMNAVDRMTVRHLEERSDPIRRQLLGLTTRYSTAAKAAGRSGCYYPSDDDVPLKGWLAEALGASADSYVKRSVRFKTAHRQSAK
jgi:ectoine hydroxylase-related dioxygenase (phytanoyl-CoA dioxygenase family)